MTGERNPGKDPVKVRQLPNVSLRIETGPIQFGKDWPGLFIRGDDAFAFWLALKAIPNPDVPPSARLSRMALTRLTELMDSCNLTRSNLSAAFAAANETGPPQRPCPVCAGKGEVIDAIPAVGTEGGSTS